jgi:hypothetical protein
MGTNANIFAIFWRKYLKNHNIVLSQVSGKFSILRDLKKRILWSRRNSKWTKCDLLQIFQVLKNQCFLHNELCFESKTPIMSPNVPIKFFKIIKLSPGQ